MLESRKYVQYVPGSLSIVQTARSKSRNRTKSVGQGNLPRLARSDPPAGAAPPSRCSNPVLVKHMRGRGVRGSLQDTRLEQELRNRMKSILVDRSHFVDQGCR